MEAIQPLIYAILPILGYVIGATLQYLFSRASEERKYQQNLRTQAYVDFIRYTALLGKAQQWQNKDKAQELGSQIAQTKLRICVYGQKKVVEAIANFHRKGATINTREGFKAFVDIIQIMRKCCLGKNQGITDDMIHKAAFSEELWKNYVKRTKN